MGNHHPHGQKSGRSTPSSTSSQNGSKKTISRTTSGNDIKEQQATALLPLEKLAKILTDRSMKDEGINGISFHVFHRSLFPRYQIFADRLYNYLLKSSKAKTTYLGTTAFKQQCEKYLAILDDDLVRETLVKMFSDDDDNIPIESFRTLLMCSYHISMDHYSEGPQMCFSINKMLTSVVESCYHGKKTLSGKYVSTWIGLNIPRLLFPLHRYAVHSLATSWRNLEQEEPTLAAGLELATPVLEQPPPFGQGKPPHPHLLTMSLSWLLAGALSPIYSRPQKAHSPHNSGVGLASVNFLAKLLCSVPSHWTLLYDSDDNGLGTNRFLHHVLSYKGPTLCLIKADNGSLFCVASPCEWKESHLYWGGEEAAVLQLMPKFAVLERGSKMLYLNTTVRGYPHGLRAGKDPRAPIISIDAGFEKVEYQKIPYHLETVEVWGCGDQVMRERQLEVKKWEVKEAERQRNVKMSAADWLDHPDRYLLELAGRPQYHDSQ
ncbi:uncharacterized protein LOC109606264 isoform X2 [Aethina tumida]|uniref:uncharacterized protein LOC109606264 isoform X2 n=1 Tax=Aethina tumida TaxID=116153 RepID=UPI002148795D|nr:uncharacterized protein LOC109606264 isoform X2 [Aethina tumida]